MVSSVKADFSFKHQFNPPNILHRRKQPQLSIDAKKIKEYFFNLDPYYIYYYRDYHPLILDVMLAQEVVKIQNFMQDRRKKKLQI